MSFLDQYKTKGDGQAADPAGPVTQVGEDFGRPTPEAPDIDLDMDIGAPYPATPLPTRPAPLDDDEPFAATATNFPRTGAGLAPPVSAGPVVAPRAPVASTASAPAARPAPAPAPVAGPASLIAESRPSELADDDLESRFNEPVPAPAAGDAGSGLPLIGRWPVSRQRNMLALLMLGGLLMLIVGVVLALGSASRGSQQLNAVGQALAHSQRLARVLPLAVAGQADAFAAAEASRDQLGTTVRRLAQPLSAEQAATVLPLAERIVQNTGSVLSQQEGLQQAGQALRRVARQSGQLLEAAQAVVSGKVQAGASAAELAVASQLPMLTQRLGRNAGEYATPEGLGPEAVVLLGKDLPALRDTANLLLEGNAELGLPGTRDAALRERIATLLAAYEPLRMQAEAVLPRLPALLAARQAQAAVVADVEPLRQALEALPGVSEGAAAAGLGAALPLIGGGLLLALLGGGGFVRLYVRDQGEQARLAQAQRAEAERQEQQAKRVNDANQAAILRLMNELQLVAEGDLTQQATVTEDITGAIADSVNYTVEELRSLVAQVQAAAGRLTETTQKVEDTSTELLAASTEQLREIHETGEAVLQMAGRINEVSAQAQQTAEVAAQSLAAAESGRAAVQDTIGGMNTMRDQIQETSKRIKRLGESSQEIGEITELISDITEQTNVLALNAAIQAASAGEAGRGFTVVAEEVQRLAERSADATRQIAALVRTIQTDTQDAVAAMEHSTQGVVESTRLSDAAGSALADIERVTRRLAELIAQISAQALSEAQGANVVAANIQHIFAVTEQTGEGTRSTSQMVRELSRTAEELSQSVARFKIN
ncbi:methyl-accepting chemotaxis protein [Aquincola sp. J276]|uniref:methyl-accepting chemotaxis protein n=1 Tax=Aquincola sp. J276 TaxID=2898432 RepID=UPI002151E132|nr:methyl-accepting chemotaxis protein [Aquincola sp. J276]MCR5866895.1 methyl-accepting chemotaxis protein [Aquincola sp. J276]